MNDTDADKILGKFQCAGCGYRSHDEQLIKKHIEMYHPNLKDDIRQRYNNIRGL